MARCDVCGNEYDRTMAIEAWGRRHTFDCFECAIHYWPRYVITAGVGSSATGWRARTVGYSAARTARGRSASRCTCEHESMHLRA